jgi:predicted ATPase
LNTIKRITFLEAWRCFPKGWTWEPLGTRGINLLVGDQGCGKSTLLGLLGTNNQKIIHVELENQEGVQTLYFDSEKHSPRAVSDLNATHFETSVVLGSRFVSHGQALLGLVEKCREAEKAIVFLDEPENGLSLRSQYRVANAIKRAQSQGGCQVFVATHSQVIMEAVKEVFSLEDNRWMKVPEFLEDQRKTGKRRKK